MTGLPRDPHGPTPGHVTGLSLRGRVCRALLAMVWVRGTETIEEEGHFFFCGLSGFLLRSSFLLRGKGAGRWYAPSASASLPCTRARASAVAPLLLIPFLLLALRAWAEVPGTALRRWLPVLPLWIRFHLWFRIPERMALPVTCLQ